MTQEESKMHMIIPTLAAAATTTQTTLTVPTAFLEALRVSGIALLAIFVVMTIFGVMIKVIGRMFPEQSEP